MHLLSQIIYSCKTLYMFRTVFLSIIRSSKLRIQQRYMSNSCCCYRGWDGTAWNLSTENILHSPSFESRTIQPVASRSTDYGIPTPDEANWMMYKTAVQIRSKDSQVKTQLVLWIFILFKVTTCFGLYHQAIIRLQVNNRTRGSKTL
jgi:hypothetical protein